MIQPISGIEKFDAALKEGNVIMGFTAPWCGYCRRLRPILMKIADEVDVPIYGINTDEDPELAKRYDVDTIPTLIFFKDGKLADRIIGDGSVGYPELKAFIDKNK